MNTIVSNFSQLSVILLCATTIYQLQKAHDELASRENWDIEYDFIVIGSGSSGSVVACRLSEDHNSKVLLLEAGGQADVVTDMPALEKSLKGGKYDWGIVTTPQKHGAFAYRNNQIPHERGKVLGGSSVVNNMNYLRGLPQDYNNWARTVDDGEWSWEGVLKYFLKAENNSDPSFVANGMHSDKGHVHFITPPKTFLIDTFINATVEFGFPSINDLNGPHFGFGAAYLQKNILRGIRQSSAAGYLKPFHKQRKNLHIVGHSQATKILFDLNLPKPRAIGVQFCRQKTCYKVFARKEVIVCGGAFNTAKLLMLSGIGPKQELEKFGIPLITDLPVGKNYVEVPILFDGLHFTINRNVSLKEVYTYDDIFDFFIDGKGPLTLNTHAALRLKDAFGRISQVRFVGGSKSDDWSEGRINEQTENLRKSVWKQFFKPYAGKFTATAWVIVHHPKSRGSVRLASKDPDDMPLVNPNFFADESDLDSFVDLMQFVYKLIKTKPFKKLQAKPFESVVPGCEKYYLKKVPVPPISYLKCVARVFVNHASDPIGTCKMGSETDKSAVVDSRLRVIGIEGLRIADASVIPVTLSGHTHTICSMIGEKASDIIKADWINGANHFNHENDHMEFDNLIYNMGEHWMRYDQ